MKAFCAALSLFVAACGSAEAQVSVDYPPMLGGSSYSVCIAFGNGIENREWRYPLYHPDECVYHIAELNRTFHFVVKLEAGTENVFIGQHAEIVGESGHEAEMPVDHTWLMPVGSYCITHDEWGPGVVYGRGLHREPTKSVGGRRSFRGWVLIDGKAYGTWCEIVRGGAPSRPQLKTTPRAEPTPALPVLPRVPRPESDADPFLAPPPPAEPTLPIPSSGRKRGGEADDNEEQEERIPLGREPIAMRDPTGVRR